MQEAKFKLGSNRIYIVKVTLGAVGPTELVHVPAKLCDAWTIKVEMVLFGFC
jgi:hypothetical protein